jgi:hypothetical protein
MDRELKLFRDLILAIWDTHRKPWLYPRGQARDIYIDIASTFTSMADRRELEASLPTEQNVRSGFPPGRFLYLNPVNRSQVLVPVLGLNYDFGRSIPELRLRLGLFLRYGIDTKAIGYRFESPEGTGIHHYYHLQMIRGFSIGSPFVPDDCLRWFPDSAPTFPLDVDRSVKLLLCLLISLYGVRETAVLLRDSGVDAQIGGYLSQMNCHLFPPIEWYWKVTIRGARAHQEFYRTGKEPREFRRDFTSLHPGCRIEGITEGYYSALGKKRKKVHR